MAKPPHNRRSSNAFLAGGTLPVVADNKRRLRHLPEGYRQAE
jgi:hypothetical protein